MTRIEQFIARTKRESIFEKVTLVVGIIEIENGVTLAAGLRGLAMRKLIRVYHFLVANCRLLLAFINFAVKGHMCFSWTMARFTGNSELRHMRIKTSFTVGPRLPADDVTLNTIAIPDASVHAQS